MKKLSLIFALVFVASLAMAQVTTQLDAPTIPLITKIVPLPFSANTVTTTQKGDNNAAEVTQTGVNFATISQISIAGATLGKANVATLSQDGSQNVANIDQNRSGGEQGSPTITKGIQEGNKNYMNVIQDGHYQGGNTSTVTQIGITEDNAKGNQADVNHQKGYGNNWVIYQEGDDNKAQQISTSDVVSGTTNIINQFGTSNNAMQKTAGGDAMYATINQGTDDSRVSGNIAAQIQGGLKSKASITQLTNDNKAYQTQVNGSYKFDGVYASQHDAEITQKGGNGNYALQYQTELVADVWANSRNTSVIMQDGGGNRAEVAQLDGLNKGDITQMGDDNKALIIQNGLSNTAETQQLTDENTANFYQNGNGNKVIAKQFGGDENVANLTQNGGSKADIMQNGEANILKGIGTDIMATSLNGSTLDLDQFGGSGNTLSLQQSNGGIATVSQNGSTNTSVVIQN